MKPLAQTCFDDVPGLRAHYAETPLSIPESMQTKQQLRLIEGTFTPAEATQMLLSLVKSKIDFHTLEKASNKERFGSDGAQSEVRLVALRSLRHEITALCQSAAGEQRLKIDGWIEITIV